MKHNCTPLIYNLSKKSRYFRYYIRIIPFGRWRTETQVHGRALCISILEKKNSFRLTVYFLIISNHQSDWLYVYWFMDTYKVTDNYQARKIKCNRAWSLCSTRIRVLLNSSAKLSILIFQGDFKDIKKILFKHSCM